MFWCYQNIILFINISVINIQNNVYSFNKLIKKASNNFFVNNRGFKAISLINN